MIIESVCIENKRKIYLMHFHATQKSIFLEKEYFISRSHVFRRKKKHRNDFCDLQYEGSMNQSQTMHSFFFICNFRLVFVTEPHFSQNAVESCGMPQKSPPDGPGKDKKSFCLLSVFKRRSLGLRMKKISCRVRGIIPA